MNCKRCHQPIAREDQHPQLRMARCRRCHSVQDLSETAPSGDAERVGVGRPLLTQRPPVPLPSPFVVSHEGGAFKVRWPWRTTGKLVVYGFGLLTNLVLLAFFSRRGFAPFLAVHAGVTLIFALTVLLHLVNSTELTLGSGQFELRHGPIPWFGNRRLSTAMFDQLYVREVMHTHKNGVSYTYELRALRRNGEKELRLVRGLREPDQALWLEQQLELRLGIVDRPVEHEVAERVG